MAVNNHSVGNLDILPAELLQRCIRYVQAQDDTGVIFPGTLEFIVHPYTNNIHHERLLEPRTKELEAGYLQSHRALCLVNKRMRQEAEAELFRNHKINIAWGWNLAHHDRTLTRSTSRAGDIPVSIDYLAARMRSVGLWRFVALPSSQSSFWFNCTFAVPLTDPTFRQIKVTSNGYTDPNNAALPTALMMRRACLNHYGRVQAFSKKGDLTVTGLLAIMAIITGEDGEMHKEKKTRMEEARIDAMVDYVYDRMMVEDGLLKLAGMSRSARREATWLFGHELAKSMPKLVW